ncbi:MAG: META domain-containing protein [Muribaculaceae bacterium]|nr:META domain-containing protein [Muribaculaceae bacterium]
MKFSILLTSICSFTLLVSSCATVNEVLGRGTVKSTPKEQKQQTTKDKPAKSKSNKRGKTSAQTTATHEARPSVGEIAGRFSEADSLALIQRLSGEWYFDSVDNITVSGDEDRPSLTFEPGTCRFYANNGCNYFNGTYAISGLTSISFDNVIETSNLCGDLPWANSIASMWYNIKGMELTLKDSEQYLELRDTRNRSVARLKRHSSAMINGLWSVVQIDGRAISADNPTLAIDLVERRVHGNTGCNLVNGTIFQDPDTDMSIQFQNLAVTRMTCPSIATETALLIGLEQVEQAVIDNPDRITLTDASNNPIVVLERAPL